MECINDSFQISQEGPSPEQNIFSKVILDKILKRGF